MTMTETASDAPRALPAIATRGRAICFAGCYAGNSASSLSELVPMT